MGRALGYAALLLWLSLGARASAQALRVDRSAEQMRVDGSLREWRGAHFATLGSGDDAALRYALCSTDQGFYLAAEISDDVLVRGKGVGPGQDALVLTLALPDARERGRDGQPKLRVSELWLHPGEVGRSRAQAGLGQPGKAPAPETRVQVVEGPRSQGTGYVMEAFIPFALLGGGELWEQGRARLAFEDVDAQGPARAPNAGRAALRTSDAARAEELPRLALGSGQNDQLGNFARAKGLAGTEPRFDLRGDVAGDKSAERVAVLDQFVVVYGPHYKGGDSYNFFALPLRGGGLVSVELADATGDGRDELFARLRQRNELGARELLSVLSLAEDGLVPLFSVELKKELSGGFVESQLAIEKPSRGGRRIRVATGRAQGLDALSYRERPAADAEPILLPWGDVKSRTYAFDGARFVVVDEQKQASKPARAPLPVTDEPLPALPAQPLPAAAPDQAAVIAQFKRDQHLPAAAQPERQLRANFCAGAAPEQLSAFGALLVLAGPEIGAGGGYFAYKLPIPDASGLLYLGAAEVTGDGAQEVLARIRQPLSGAAEVHRELLLVLRADAQGRLARVLAVEVARRQGESAIVNRVRSERGALLIEPGQAQGFSQSSYPFLNEATGGVERLLLPWLDRPVRYRLVGERLVAE